jgi:hypothetical protein
MHELLREFIEILRGCAVDYRWWGGKRSPLVALITLIRLLASSHHGKS